MHAVVTNTPIRDLMTCREVDVIASVWRDVSAVRVIVWPVINWYTPIILAQDQGWCQTYHGLVTIDYYPALCLSWHHSGDYIPLCQIFCHQPLEKGRLHNAPMIYTVGIFEWYSGMSLFQCLDNNSRGTMCRIWEHYHSKIETIVLVWAQMFIIWKHCHPKVQMIVCELEKKIIQEHHCSKIQTIVRLWEREVGRRWSLYWMLAMAELLWSGLWLNCDQTTVTAVDWDIVHYLSLTYKHDSDHK
jgi:hypothetical protein